jgi:hypothetical protein
MHTTRSKQALSTIARAALVAGTLDIVAATISFIIQRQQEPTRMLQFIASGVFGREAFTGGITMALLGLLFHFILAFIFAALLFLLYPRAYRLFRNKIFIGLLYGIFVWFIMNRLVLPLSHAPAIPFNWLQLFIGMGILMLCIGLPMAFIVHRHYHGIKNAVHV